MERRRRSWQGSTAAGCGPAGGAILASVFPARLRATYIGGFLAAASFGSVLGLVLGGIITVHWSWQAAFGIVGANRGFTTRIVQLERNESDALLEMLYRHIETPEFMCPFKWQPGRSPSDITVRRSTMRCGTTTRGAAMASA